jgi:preprotein translocase subunit SecY
MEGVLSPVFQLMVAPAGMLPAVLAVSVVKLPAQIGEVPEMETGAKY